MDALKTSDHLDVVLAEYDVDQFRFQQPLMFIL